LKCSIQIVENYYSNISDCIQIIAEYCIHILKNSNEEEVRLLAYEVFCRLGDLDLKNNSLFENTSKQYLDRYSSILLNIALTNLFKIEEDSDWDESKACCYLLCLISQLCDAGKLEQIILYADRNLYSSDVNLKHSAILALSSSLETIHKDELLNILKFNFQKYYKAIYDNVESIQIISSWMFCKISELHCSIFERSSLSQIIPEFLELIKYSNNSVLVDNLCNTLSNIITNYGNAMMRGNVNAINPYSVVIIDTASTRSSFSAYQLIINVIKYSSHDFQDKLELLLENYYNRLIKSNNAREKENILLVIQAIFDKIIRKVNDRICNLIFLEIVNYPVSEETVSCLSYIAMSIIF
jgi:hypothetical protein